MTKYLYIPILGIKVTKLFFPICLHLLADVVSALPKLTFGQSQRQFFLFNLGFNKDL